MYQSAINRNITCDLLPSNVPYSVFSPGRNLTEGGCHGKFGKFISPFFVSVYDTCHEHIYTVEIVKSDVRQRGGPISHPAIANKKKLSIKLLLKQVCQCLYRSTGVELNQ